MAGVSRLEPQRSVLIFRMWNLKAPGFSRGVAYSGMLIRNQVNANPTASSKAVGPATEHIRISHCLRVRGSGRVLLYEYWPRKCPNAHPAERAKASKIRASSDVASKTMRSLAIASTVHHVCGVRQEHAARFQGGA